MQRVSVSRCPFLEAAGVHYCANTLRLARFSISPPLFLEKGITRLRLAMEEIVKG